MNSGNWNATTSAGVSPGISALVIVHNEELILDECLKRLDWADEICVVLDKCTDRSKEIALSYNARILEGSWEKDGSRHDVGFDFCRTEWIFEVDSDEWITGELAKEVRATINAAEYDVYDVKVDNYVGGRHIVHGWGGGALGKDSCNALFRKGLKRWGPQRAHPHITVAGTVCPECLKNPIIHNIFADISAIIRCVDRYSTYRAKDLVRNNEVGSLANAARKFLSRFWKIYVKRRAWKEKELGFVLAFCAGLYPLISHIKAIYEDLPPEEFR